MLQAWGLKGQVGADADHPFILQPLARGGGIDDAAAGIADILQVGLELQPGGELGLIGEFDQGFGALDRGDLIGAGLGEIRLGALTIDQIAADLADPDIDAGGVIRATGQRVGEGQAEIGAEADEVAIRRRAHQASEKN